MTARAIDYSKVKPRPHPYQATKLHGVRPDVSWLRPGKQHARRGLTNRKLIQALEGMDLHRGRKWGHMDTQTKEEADQRAWGLGEIQSLRVFTRPSWLLEVVEVIPQRRMQGYVLFLGLLIAAYRAGAIGLMLSYPEVMAICGVRSSRTWRNWCIELEELGLVRIVQTWRQGKDGRPQQHGRLLYRIGPTLEAYGPALLEGVLDEGTTQARWCTNAARALRARAKKARQVRKEELWQAAVAASTDEPGEGPAHECATSAECESDSAGGKEGVGGAPGSHPVLLSTTHTDTFGGQNTGALGGARSDEGKVLALRARHLLTDTPSATDTGTSGPELDPPAPRGKAAPKGRAASSGARAVSGAITTPERPSGAGREQLLAWLETRPEQPNEVARAPRRQSRGFRRGCGLCRGSGSVANGAKCPVCGGSGEASG